MVSFWKRNVALAERFSGASVFTVFFATILWFGTFGLSHPITLSWDDSDVIRLSRCFSYSIWENHSILDLSCWSSQWRSPLFNFLLGFTPYSPDTQKYSEMVFVTYGVILSLAAWAVARTICDLTSHFPTKLFISAIAISVFAFENSSSFRAQLQVDGLLTLVAILYVCKLVKILSSSSPYSRDFIFLILLSAFLPLLKLSTVIYSVSTMLCIVVLFVEKQILLKQFRTLLSLFILASAIPVTFYIFFPSSFKSALSLSSGPIAEFYSNYYLHNWQFKVSLLGSFSLPCILLLTVIIAKRKNLKTKTYSGFIILMYFTFVNIAVFLLPATDYHYLAPLIIPLIFFAALRISLRSNAIYSSRKLVNVNSAGFCVYFVMCLLLGMHTSILGLKPILDINRSIASSISLPAKVCIFSDSALINFPKFLLIYGHEANNLDFVNLADDGMNNLTFDQTLHKAEMCNYFVGQPKAKISDSLKNSNVDDLYKVFQSNSMLVASSQRDNWVILKRS